MRRVQASVKYWHGKHRSVSVKQPSGTRWTSKFTKRTPRVGDLHVCEGIDSKVFVDVLGCHERILSQVDFTPRDICRLHTRKDSGVTLQQLLAVFLPHSTLIAFLSINLAVRTLT